MILKNRLLALFPVVALALLPSFANATAISGEFGMSGSATVSAISLDFFCAFGLCGGTRGDFTVSPIVATGDFALLGGSVGTIEDLNQFGGQPLNTAFSLPGWITFNLAPDIFLDLQFIPLGTGTASATCDGVAFCTPIIGPLIGTPNNPDGLSAFNIGPGNASFEVRGIGYRTDSASGSTPFVGRISADFAGLTAAQIVDLFAGGTINKAYSANFVISFVPEPSTGLLMFGGVFLAAAGSLRRYLQRRGSVE